MGARGFRLVAAAALWCVAGGANASSGGISGVSGNPSAAHGSSSTCSGCHSGGAQTGSPSIAGSTSVSTNSATAFTVQLSSSNATAAGFNLSITTGTLAAGSGSYLIDYGAGGNFELTHSSKQFLSGSAASWGFTWTAPNTTGTNTMYVCINRVNNDASTTGDSPTCTTKTITVTNSAPSLNASVNASPAFTEGGGAVVLDGVLTLSDVDGDNLNRAEVEITGAFSSGNDTLACPSCAGQGLSASFSSVTGILTITGTATTTAYDTALQSVTFNNTSNTPSTSTRTVAFRIRDDHNNFSVDDSLFVTVAATNDAPVLTTPASIGVTEDSASALTGISVSDVDSSSGTLTYTFTVASGTLNSPSCAGVTSGGTSTSRTLTGTTTNLNTCISGSNLTFTTASNTTTTVSLGVSITDNGNTGGGGAQVDSAAVSLTVTAVNDAPSISAPASIGVTEDVASALTGISFSDVDSASGTLTATFTVGSGTLSSPSCASVTSGGTSTARTLTGTTTNLNSCISGSNLTFTTASNATTTVSLGIALTDNGNTGTGGAQAASPAAVNLTVTNVNDAPTAVADAPSVSKNSSSNSLDVLANDTDPDSGVGDTQSIFSVGAPSHGGAVVIGSPCSANRLCYTPATNYSGTETFTYTMQDGAGLQSSATVTVTVGTGVAPTANTDSASVLEDSTATVIDVLANDTDGDVGDTREITQVDGSSSFPVAVTGGSVSLSGSGPNNTLSFTPTANYFGTPSFNYTVRDAGLLTAVGTVNVTVTAVNDAPTLNAIGNPAAINEDATQQTVNLSGIGAGGGESQTLVVTASSSNTALIPHPTVTYTSANATGSLAYTPIANANGSAVVTVTVTDDGGTTNGGVNSVQRTFTVTVNSVNDAPTLNAIANPAAINEDAGQQTVNLSGIGAGGGESQALSVTASSSNTALIPNPTVTYASANATGSLAYTPVADANGSAIVTVTVTDNGGTANGGVDTLQRTFTVNVNAQNDTPVVAAIPDQAVNDNTLFTYTASVTDADGETSFTFALTGAPAGMAIDGGGTITWTPPVGTSGVFTPTVEATDGSSATGTRSFQITVTAPDADGDGMPDSFEDLYGLDKNDASDAALDADGDGVSNLDEYLGATNPTTDDIAPSLAAPADLVVPATGYYTVVDLGQATASDGKDGVLAATSDLTLPVVRPGRYVVTWTAQDQAGNVATDTQIVDVLPLVQCNVDQPAVDGNTVAVTVTLNGNPPEYPVTIPYTVGGTAGASDSDAVSGAFVINSGTTATVNVAIAVDGPGEQPETVVFTMDSATNAALDARHTHTITIYDANVAPAVSLAVAQGALPRLVAYQDDGVMTITADAVDANGNPLTYDWSGSADALGIDGVTGAAASFPVSGLTAGIGYPVTVTVADGQNQTTRTVLVVLVTGSSPDVDVDADGVADGVAAAFDEPALLPDQAGDPAIAAPLEVEPGLTLRRGRTSLAAGRTGALILMSDLVSVGVGEGGLALGADSYENVGGIFDFEVHGLAVGGSANVVLPLQTAIREGSVYRKFDPVGGWHDFVTGAGDAVASASSSFGQCPGPASDGYVAGLQPFADCVRLTLTDGGPNDADGLADGVIRDPGGVAIATGASGDEAASVSSGAFLALWLPLALLLRLRRRAGVALLALLAMLTAAPAHADHHIRIHYSGDVASGFDSNVTNAQQDADIRESGFASASGNVDYLRNISLYTTLLLRGSLQGEYWNSFDGLNNGKGTAMARLLYRGDGDFWTPTFAAWVSAGVMEFDSAIRDSNEYRAGAFVTENLTTQVTGRFALGASRRESDGFVYDLSGYSASMNLDWVPAPHMVVYTGYQYYVGDVASTASAASFWIVEAAEAIEADDAFGGLAGGLLAYRLDARAQITTLGFNYAFGRKLSADVQGQYISTRATSRIDYERMVGVVSLLARF